MYSEARVTRSRARIAAEHGETPSLVSDRLPATTRTGRKAVPKRDQVEACPPTVLFAAEAATVEACTPDNKKAPANSPKPTPTGLGLSSLPPVTPGLPIVAVNASPRPTPAHGPSQAVEPVDIQAVAEALESAHLEDADHSTAPVSPSISPMSPIPQTFSSAFFSPAATLSPNEHFSTPRALEDSPCGSISLGGTATEVSGDATPGVDSAIPEAEAVPDTPTLDTEEVDPTLCPPTRELSLELTLAPTPFPGQKGTEDVSPEPIPTQARVPAATPAVLGHPAEINMTPGLEEGEIPGNMTPGVSPAILLISQEEAKKDDEVEVEQDSAEESMNDEQESDDGQGPEDTSSEPGLIKAVRVEPEKPKGRMVGSRLVVPTPGFHFKSLRQLKKDLGRKLNAMRKKEEPQQDDAGGLTDAMADLSLEAPEKLKGLPTPAGKHIRFTDNGEAMELPQQASDNRVNLRGLPKAAGQHIRFDD